MNFRLFHAIPVLSIVAAFPLVSCDQSLSPGSGLSVTVESVGPPTALANQVGSPIMQCDVGLTAVNTGSTPVYWTIGVMHVYPGGDTTIHGDSVRVSSGQIAAIWGAPDVKPTERRSVNWPAAAPGPYFGVMDFRFQDSTSTGFGVARVSLLCGAARVRAGSGTGRPTITDFSFDGPDSVPPGGYLWFNLAATDTDGLWTALIRPTACETSAIQLEWADLPTSFSSRDGSLAIPVPTECPSGPLSVAVTIRNAFLHQTVDTLTAFVR